MQTHPSDAIVQELGCASVKEFVQELGIIVPQGANLHTLRKIKNGLMVLVAFRLLVDTSMRNHLSNFRLKNVAVPH